MYGKSYENRRLPSWFPFDVIKLTGGRYKCAGWHIVRDEFGLWSLMVLGGTIQHTGYQLIENAATTIVNEYQTLVSEVEMIEEERGKIQT